MDIVNRARALLDSRTQDRITLAELAQAVGASPYHLQRSFKRRLGLSPKDYQRERRLETAKQLFSNGGQITDSLFEAGYGSVSRFYEKAADRLGMRARDYRAKGKGQRIAYSTFASPLGRVLVALTARGVCAVKLGSDAERLIRQLAAEFAEAELVADRAALEPVRRRILDFLAGDATLAGVPLDIRGTVFQRRVWDALRRIPRGETRSYGDIARAIGAPRAVRAVGGACGANPVALIVPCHRALRTGGGLGGYAWGLEVKEKLLEIEARRSKRRARQG